MATTITDGTTSVVPDLVTDYAYERPARTIVHTLLGRADADVTLRPVGLRRGSLRMLCSTRALASAVENVHVAERRLTLTDDDEPTADMIYVMTGAIAVDYDADRDLWWVTVGYQEVDS